MPILSSVSRPAIGSRRSLRIATSVVSLFAVGGIATCILVTSGTPIAQILTFAAFCAGGVLIPGFILHRGLRGPSRSWATEAAFAGATGIMYSLVGWAIFSAADVRDWLWVWPALMLLALAWPSWRRRTLALPTGSWHPLTSVGVAAAIATALLHLHRTFLNLWPLPVSNSTYYPDLLWHMGLAAEATRSFPLMVPQAITAGELEYHWFANAHMAVLSLMTGIDIPTVVLRFWPVLMVTVVILLVAATGEAVSRRQLVAPIAALLTAVPLIFTPWWPLLDVQDALRPLSPSQLLAFIPLLMIVAVGAQVLKATRLSTGLIVLLSLSLVIGAGAKPTVLPIVSTGAVVGAVAAAVAREKWQRMLAIAILAAVLYVVAGRLIAGGDAGVSLTLLSITTLFGFIRERLPTDWPAADSWVVPGIFTEGTLILAAIAAALVSVARLLFGLAPVFTPVLRRNPTAWWMSGMCAASAGAFLLLAHPGYSQLYFSYTAVPIGAILGGWWLAAAVHGHVRVAITAALAGLALGWVGFLLGNSVSLEPGSDIRRGLAWTAVCAAIVVCGVAAVLIIRRLRGKRRFALSAGFIPLAIGVMLASIPYAAFAPSPPSPVSSADAYSQSEAAMWLRDNTDSDALLATNDHCLAEETAICDSRQYWISGLANRRVLLESWSYVAASADLNPSSVARPTFDPRLLRFNQALFASPTERDLLAARDMGVEYLVATGGASEISEDLSALSDVVYRNAHITIFRLR